MAKKGSSLISEWLHLQRRLVGRASDYVQDLGELFGEGSLEPREYVERYTKYWGKMIGEVGDWLRDVEPDAEDAPVAQIKILKITESMGSRVHARPIKLRVPIELFDGDPDASFSLSVRKLTRLNPRGVERPPMSFVLGKHFRMHENDVTRSNRGEAQLKIYDVPDNLVANDVYRGTLWATPFTKQKTAKGTKRIEGDPVPIAVIELTIK